MIRTGYLRWEIEVEDRRSAVDPYAREVHFRARPSSRRVRILSDPRHACADRFARGEVPYQAVPVAGLAKRAEEVVIGDVTPHLYRYAEADRFQMPRFWMAKLQRESLAYAHEIVRCAARFPRLISGSAAVQTGYAYLVQQEIVRVIEGRSQAAPTNEVEPVEIMLEERSENLPELVAAELVRDVVDAAEFEEFCRHDRITVWSGDHIFRIARRSHALIDVWDANTRRGVARLCVVFEDAGLPPSDEVVMKYLLARHQPDLLWQIGIRFAPPAGRCDVSIPTH